jgi:predicted DNA-binding transcriptional regulator AlpA
MERTLSDADIEAIASHVVKLIGLRLSTAEPQPPPPAPAPPPPAPKAPPAKLAFNLKELSQELGISKITLYRMEARGLLKPLPYFRTKVFSRAEVERFLACKEWSPKPFETTGSRRKRT